jgi:hypothetical protein
LVGKEYEMLSDQTVFPCSLEECGRYLETIKVFENKPADSIREHTDNDYLSRVCTLTSTTWFDISDWLIEKNIISTLSIYDLRVKFSATSYIVLPLIQISCHRVNEPRHILGNILAKCVTINFDQREY